MSVSRQRNEYVAHPLPFPHRSRALHEPPLAAEGSGRTTGQSPYALIVDTMVLKSDLERCCRDGRRTALLDAGAGPSVRIYGSHHAANEMYEHLPEWFPEPEQLKGAWRTWEDHYLPILRFVEVSAVHENMLSAEEVNRIQLLRTRDPDDVPSAVLALVLGAPILTKDHPLIQAVYGEGIDGHAYAEWLGSVLAARTLGEADYLVLSGLVLANTMANISVGSVDLTVAGLRKLPPAGLVATALAVGIGLIRYGDEVKRRSGILMRAFSQMSDEVLPVFEKWRTERLCANTHLSSIVPPLPEVLSSDQNLIRNCASSLARLDHCSARRLYEHLLELPNSTSEKRTRAALRESSLFLPSGRGEWQIGRHLSPLGWDYFRTNPGDLGYG